MRQQRPASLCLVIMFGRWVLVLSQASGTARTLAVCSEPGYSRDWLDVLPHCELFCLTWLVAIESHPVGVGGVLAPKCVELGASDGLACIACCPLYVLLGLAPLCSLAALVVRSRGVVQVVATLSGRKLDRS